MRTCLREAIRKLGTKVVMIIDNAPCHSQLESVFQETEFKEHILLRLGLYSPMFIAMENVWSSAKTTSKRDMTRKMNEILRGNTLGFSLTKYKLNCLKETIIIGMRTITIENCTNFIARTFSKVIDLPNLVDMVF